MKLYWWKVLNRSYSFFTSCLWLPFYAKNKWSQKKKNAWQTLSYTILNHKNPAITSYTHSRKIHKKRRKNIWESVSLFDAKFRLGFYIFDIIYQKSIIPIISIKCIPMSLSRPEVLSCIAAAPFVSRAIQMWIEKWLIAIWQSWFIQKRIQKAVNNTTVLIEQPTEPHIIDFNQPWYK